MFIEGARWPDDSKGTNNDRLSWHTARFPIIADDASQETKDLVASRGGRPVGDAIAALELQVSVMANPEAGANERALALSSGDQIDLADLPILESDEGDSRDSTDGFPRSTAQRRLSLREVEDMYIEEVMRITGGNKVQAAKILGIDRKTLYRKLERYGYGSAKSPDKG